MGTRNRKAGGNDALGRIELAHGAASSGEDIIGETYIANFMNRTIAVYEYRRPNYRSADWDSDGGVDLVKDVAVEFVSGDRSVEWKWPQTPYRWDLLDAIRYQRSRAAEFFDALFAR